jgi:hypothetical protein
MYEVTSICFDRDRSSRPKGVISQVCPLFSRPVDQQTSSSSSNLANQRNNKSRETRAGIHNKSRETCRAGSHRIRQGSGEWECQKQKAKGVVLSSLVWSVDSLDSASNTNTKVPNMSQPSREEANHEAAQTPIADKHPNPR